MNAVFLIIWLFSFGGAVSSSYFVAENFEFFNEIGLSTSIILGACAMGAVSVFTACTNHLTKKELGPYTFISWLFLVGVSIYNATLIDSNRLNEMSNAPDIYIFYIVYICLLFSVTALLFSYYFKSWLDYCSTQRLEL